MLKFTPPPNKHPQTPNPPSPNTHTHTPTHTQSQPGVDYVYISKGARNPFRSTVDPFNGDVYFGDVGSSVWEVCARVCVCPCVRPCVCMCMCVYYQPDPQSHHPHIDHPPTHPSNNTIPIRRSTEPHHPNHPPTPPTHTPIQPSKTNSPPLPPSNSPTIPTTHQPHTPKTQQHKTHKQEINRIPNPLDEMNEGQVVNFGWPCIEGVNAVSDIFQNFLK
jgi:hypothetical protein